MAPRICIVYNQDVMDWKDYFVREFENSGGHAIRTVLDSDFFMERTDEEYKAFIVILSPGHRTFLLNNCLFNYGLKVKECTAGMIFLCGNEHSDIDLNVHDGTGKPLVARFPQYNPWTRYPTSDPGRLISAALGKIASIRLPTFKMIPTTVPCGVETTIFLSFSDVIDDVSTYDSNVEVKISSALSRQKCELHVSSLNEKTVYFVAPEQRIPGEATVEVIIRGQGHVGTARLNYVDSMVQSLERKDVYVAMQKKHPIPTGSSSTNSIPVDLLFDISQIYIRQISHICSVLVHQKPAFELETLLLDGIFKDNPNNPPLPVRALEQLFSVYKDIGPDVPRFECPTLLHLAKKFDFKKLLSKLEDLPDATVARTLPALNAVPESDPDQIYDTVEFEDDTYDLDTPMQTASHAPTIEPPYPKFPGNMRRVSSNSAASFDSAFGSVRSSVASGQGMNYDPPYSRNPTFLDRAPVEPLMFPRRVDSAMHTDTDESRGSRNWMKPESPPSQVEIYTDPAEISDRRPGMPIFEPSSAESRFRRPSLPPPQSGAIPPNTSFARRPSVDSIAARKDAATAVERRHQYQLSRSNSSTPSMASSRSSIFPPSNDSTIPEGGVACHVSPPLQISQPIKNPLRSNFACELLSNPIFKNRQNKGLSSSPMDKIPNLPNAYQDNEEALDDDPVDPAIVIPPVRSQLSTKRKPQPPVPGKSLTSSKSCGYLRSEEDNFPQASPPPIPERSNLLR